MIMREVAHHDDDHDHGGDDYDDGNDQDHDGNPHLWPLFAGFTKQVTSPALPDTTLHLLQFSAFI